VNGEGDIRFGLAQVLGDDVVVVEEETDSDEGQDDVYP